MTIKPDEGEIARRVKRILDAELSVHKFVLCDVFDAFIVIELSCVEHIDGIVVKFLVYDGMTTLLHVSDYFWH